MGEPTACLRRSFSNPSEISHDFSQGDPYRALGESISFGRYMSESLAWEKWSTFSRNRYLEEAKNYSKPGSVAKMKAYFEAHYGRFGARKRAAEEQPNDDPDRVELGVEDTHSAEIHPSSLTSSEELASAISGPAINHETTRKDIPGVGYPSVREITSTCECSAQTKVQNEALNVVDSGAVANAIKSPVVVQLDECQDEKATLSISVSSAENGVEDELDVELRAHLGQSVEETVSVSESSSKDEIKGEQDIMVQAHQFQDATTNISMTKTSAENEVEDAHETDIALTTKARKVIPKKLPEISDKKTKKSSLSKLSSSLSRLSTPARPKKEVISIPSKSNVPKLSSSLSRLSTPARPKKEVTSTPSKSNVPEVSSSLAKLATPVRPKKDGNETPNNRKSVKEPIWSRKQAVNSIHMSINVDSDIHVVKKPSPASHRSGVSKLFTPLGKMIRNSFVPSSGQNRTSVSSVSRHPSATPQSESRRSRVALDKAFARNTTLEQKLKSPSVGNVKSSIQSPATFSPFSFRTEERAAKRRELFQKRLEKEAENLQTVANAKAKPTPDSRKSSQSVNPQGNAVVYRRKEILGDNMKIPSSQSQPLEYQGKSASELVQDKSSRPPQRNAASKPASQNNKPLPTPLLMKKKRHENASPNIL